MKFSFEPEWGEIEKARDTVADFLNSHNISANIVEAAAMVVSELAENAIKYGDFSDTHSTVTANISLEGNSIIIEVTHPVGQESFAHLIELDKTIQWIRGFQDPFEAYIEKLRELSKKSLGDHTSGLGLVRIAYEGQATLDFFVDERDMLNISAISNWTEGV